MEHQKHCGKLFVFFISAVVYTASAVAAPVTVTNGSQLVGFDSIDVDGTLYDVRFIDDSFNHLFIDAVGLDFTSAMAANTASEALLSAFDLFPTFDDDPASTAGCTYTFVCKILTPYHVTPPGVQSSYVYNSDKEDDDGTGPHIWWWRNYDTRYSTDVVYADWSVGSPRSVPEPQATVLIGIGLIGLLGFSRRHNRLTQTAA